MESLAGAIIEMYRSIVDEMPTSSFKMHLRSILVNSAVLVVSGCRGWLVVDGRTGARKTFSSISCCFPETMRTDQKGSVPFVLNS